VGTTRVANGLTFGRLLRHWRQARGLSQLALALDAEISSRHVSFLETGRTTPSREMVQRLGAVLDLPLDERNALALAAGYAPAYGERELAAPELAHVHRALSFILRQQEPYPAIVVDRTWNVVMHNEASTRIFGRFRAARLSPDVAGNALLATFHPDGIRQFIVNWEELAGPLIHTVHREAATSEAAARLRDALLAYPGVPARWKVPDPIAAAAPVLSMQLKRDDLSLAFFSTITTLATPQDVTLQQLRIECFHPADTATEAIARQLAATPLPPPSAAP
jgi:transcriptional regulator with XRE-family HTH domain